MTNLALQDIQNDLHISNSQIGTYQSCSLKYYYHYVEKRKSESLGIALFFGSAIHSALALYYSSIKNGKTENLDHMIESFVHCLELDIENAGAPVAYPKSMPDKEAAIHTGKGLLEVFYESVDLSGYEVVGVEMPLSAPLYTDEGESTDFQLVGIIDLLLRKQNEGGYLIVDNKTAAKSMSQSSADEDTQMTAYSYLLACNKYIFRTSAVECRFDVLLKLKKPRLQKVTTYRTRDDRKRFAKIAKMVLAGIDNRIFYPQTSWMCSSCGYAEACSEW